MLVLIGLYEFAVVYLEMFSLAAYGFDAVLLCLFLGWFLFPLLFLLIHVIRRRSSFIFVYSDQVQTRSK